MKLVIYIFLFFSSFRAVGSQCAAVGGSSLIAETLQCSFLNVAASENGGISSVIKDGSVINTAHLIDGDIVNDALDKNNNPNSEVNISFSRPYIVNTIRITEWEDGTESEIITLQFSDGSMEEVTLSSGFKDPEELSFTPRETLWVKLVEKRKYEEGLTLFTEIEIYFDGCQKDKICHYVELDTQETASALFLFGQTFSFMRNTANKMYLEFYSNKNERYMQLSLTEEVSLLDSISTVVAGPNTIPGGISHWVPFWIDFRSVGHIIVGAGATVFFDYDTGISEIHAYGKFILQSSSSEKLVYCQQKASCFENASHYWPLDKLVSNMAYDMISQTYASSYGAITMNLDGPPLSNGKRTSILLQDDYIDLDYSTTCINNLDLCLNGFSFSVWLQIESLQQTTRYYLVAGTSTVGFAILSPAPEERMVSDNELEIEFQNSVRQWRISVSLTVKEWHYIGCSWHPEEGLICLINIKTVLKGTEGAPVSSFGPFTLGMSTTVPNSFAHASFSDLAVWDKKLTTSDFQSLYYCSGVKPYPEANNSLGIGSYKLPDKSFSASTYTDDGAPYLARNELGGWISKLSDDHQFLQIDFFALVEIYSLEIEGNSAENAFVKTFILSKSQNGLTWDTYQDDDGKTKVFEGNSQSGNKKKINLDNHVITRYLRINVVTYNETISMKLEIFGNEKHAKYVGCLPAATAITSEVILTSLSDPFDCMAICSKQNKPYALLYRGGACYCSDVAHKTAAVVNDLFCKVPCKKTKMLSCGGQNHVSVFDVKEFDILFQVFAPEWTLESSNINITSSDSPSFQVYSENIVIPTQLSYLPLSFLGNGFKSLVFEATIGQYKPETIQVQHSIFVASKAKRFSLTCPRLVVVPQSYECVLEGYASKRDVFQYSIDGSFMASPTLQAGFVGNIGGRSDAVVEVNDVQSGVLFISSFVESAILTAIELHAQKSGYLNIQIYRPLCGTGPYREYCDINKICTYFNPVCNKISSYTCPMDQLLHLSTGQCLVKDSSNCIGNSRMPQFISQKYQRYELVYDIQVFVKYGVNIFKQGDKEVVNVYENDVIGVSYPKESAARLGVESRNGYEIYVDVPKSAELVGGDYIEVSENQKVVHLRHSLKANYVLPQKTTFTITLPPGVHQATAVLDNAVNHFESSQQIIAGVPVKDLSWIVQDIIATHDELVISVTAIAGTNITFNVIYGDGHVEEVFQQDALSLVSFTHVYTSAGYKSLELHVSNYFTEEVAHHTLLVQDYIKDVNLTTPVLPTKFTHATAIDWYVDSGSRVTIKIDLGDGTRFSNESLDIQGVLARPIRHVYPQPIEYWVNITAYNLVNRIQLYFMVIVEIPIVNITSLVVHANRDIEVNETVLIKLHQLNGTNVIHHFQFQDTSTLLTRDIDIFKNYSYWFVFLVNITAWNNVTSVTWTQPIKVHKPVRELTGFVITTSPTNHTDPVKFDFKMETGSDFNCTWDFDDKLYGKTDYWILHSEVYIWPITEQVVYHKYAGIGVYIVRINCTNRLYETSAFTISVVQVPISKFNVDPPPPQPNDEDLVVDFRAATGTNISYVVTFYHIWERQSIEITNVNITKDTLNGRAIISKEYFMNRVGLYEVKITAINLVTPLQVITRRVIVDRPIRNAYIVIHALYVQTNRTVNYTIYADASNVTITWDLNDPHAGDLNVRQNWFQGVYSVDGWTIYHKFKHSAFYTVSAELTNSLGSVIVTKKIIGQYGVYLRTSTDSPRPLPPGRMNYTFTPLPRRYHPTDAQMIMYFGDGTNYTGPYNSTLIHFYESWGIFKANCSMWNEIDWGYFEFEVEIQRVITGLKLTPFHSAGDAGFWGPARGDDYNRLPLEYDVIWNVTSKDGTNITYTYNFGDGKSEVTTNATVFHKYPRVDYFTADVFAENAVSSGSASFKIRIQQIVRGLDINSDCPNKLGNPTNFHITIDQVGTESCYLLKFGNNSLNFLFKDAENTICEQGFLDLADKTEVFNGKNTFNVTYTYGFIDVYWPRFIGSNLVSKTWKFHKSVVLHDTCRYPDVNVFNIGRNTSLAPKIFRASLFFVDTQNTIICEASKTTSFLWEVSSVNLAEGENDTLETMPLTTSISNPRFRIDPRLLPYGLYKMRFSITMLGIDGVVGFDDAFLEIVPSPMIATIVGGSGLAKGFQQNVTLDASGSQDPDVGPEIYENITITWECRALTAPAGTTAEQAGCGVDKKTVLKNGSAADLVMLNTTFTKLPNVVYCLKLVVEKNARRVLTYFNIYAKPVELLPVFVKCLQNCKKKRITAVKMAYTGGIKDLYDPETLKRVKYEWELLAAPEIGALKRIDESKWKKVPEFASEMVATTADAVTVVISEKMLWPISRYRVRLYVTLDEMEGFAEEEFFMNQPPSEGKCTINPEEGYALETDFRVICSGWRDNDMPLSYKFAYKKSEDDFESLIYFGSKSETPPIKLPLGKASLNYSVLVIVDAADSFLAANVSTLNATVIPKPVVNQDEFENEMKNMISTDGPLGNMMASGDAHSAAQLTGSLSSILDDQASKIDEAAIDELLEEEEIDIEAMTPEEQEELLKKRMEKKRQKEEENKRKKEKEKQARIEMRKIMESTLANIPIDSVEAIREKAAASAMISNTPGEVTADMQDSTMNSAMEMIAFLGNSTISDEPPNPQDSFNAAGGLMSTLGNAMEASIETGAAYNNSDADGETNSTKAQSASKDLVNKALENVENLATAVLNQKFAGEPPTEVKTERLSMAVERTNPSSFGKKPATTGGGGFLMPDAGSLFGIEGNDTSGMPPVDTKAVSNTKNPFAWDPSGAAIKSKVMTMEMKNASGHPIKISNLSKPIDIWVPRSSYVNFTLYTMTFGAMLYRAFTVVKNDTSIQVEILPEDNNTELIAYLRFGKFPKEDLYDHKFLVPKREFIDESANGTKSNKTKTREINPYIFFVSNEDLNRTAAGKYYVGIKYNGTFKPVYEAKMSGTKVLYKKYIPTNINLTMRTFTSSCLYWDTDNETWSTEGCTVGNMTAMEGTQCFCTHLTSFGGDMVVAPNTIDWSAISLDNLFSNPVVFAVVVSFILLYFILLIPARRQDKKDLEKLGVVPLSDNDPRDCYSYEITVYTGFSAEAGSTADIYFILKGSRDETPVRLLKDPSKEKFSAGSIRYFLLTVPSSLGKLKSIRIWHDNGGSSPSWYLLRLMIHDIQKDSKTWFLCDRWLAVEEDDGEIERNLRPASGEDLTKFNLLFQTEARKNLADGHIWFSVIKRPARSNFTRVQRLSCCLCILLTTMLANAMFYQNDPSSSGDGVLKVGPISFSLQQLSIAITSSLVVLPVNLFVVWIFRNTRPYKKSQDRNGTGEKSSEKKGEGAKKKTSLPYWMIYVAYSLICLACLVSGTFTVFYGLTFGKAKSEAWISAMMLSFWQDVLVSQPLKVFAAATLFALLTKDPKKATGEDEDTQMSPELRQDEEFVPKRTFVADEAGLMSMARIDPKPLDPQKLQACREVRLKQKQMKLIIYDIIWYFVFVIVLLSVAHGNKDPMGYHTTSTMSNFFEENSYTDWISLSEVTDPRLYWYWSRYSLIPTLIPNQWYGPNRFLENVVWTNADAEISRSRGSRSRLRLSRSKQRKLQGRPGEFPDMVFALNDSKEYPTSFIADRATHYTVGVARYRQLRVQQNQCKVLPIFQHIFSECNSFYSWEKEDEGNYHLGWVPENITTNKTIDEERTSKQKNAWQYNTAWELKGTPYWAGFSTYWGGGFVADLGHNESLALNMTAFLQKFNWLDRYTRAIFIEFTVYNPNTNFFCLVTLVTEIIPTGGYYQFNQVYPVRLYRYYGPNLLAIMVLEITLMTFLLYFAYREFKKWRREGRLYWKEPWNYMELLVLASCFSTIGLYFARMVATNYSIGLMRDDATRFVSFHYAAALDEWSSFTLGMAVFLSFLKTLRLLRFNRRMSFMSKTLKICAKPLASFFIVYLIVFLAYATFGFLVFGKVAYDYHTFQSSMANVLGMTLGAFNFYALVEAHSTLGPTFFFTFTFVVNFILINVFVAIISEALATVTSDAAYQSNDHEMLDFMVHELKSFIGQRVSPAIKPVYKEPLSELDENLEQIQKKGESLEVALRNMCMEEIRHTSWLDPDKCPKKKKLLMQLLINVGEEITEYDICDAIPLLEEVLATYTEKDIKEWLGEYTEFDESESCRSSCLFTRTSMYDSDEDSEDEDGDSENESLREGRWSELSGETTIIPLFAERKFFSEDASEGGEAKSGGMDDYLYDRPPSTAERFCRTATTISMTSLNENVDMVNQIIGDDDCERLFIEDSEELGEEEEEREVENNLAKEESEEEREEEEEHENEEMDSITAWMVNSKAATMTSRPPVDARQEETSKQELFQQSYSPRNVKHGEEITIEEFNN